LKLSPVAAGLLVFLLVQGPPRLGAAPNSAAAARPERLIRQLSHGSLAARDAAVAGLLDCGPAALPAIERALPTAGGEAAFRLPLIAAAIAVAETNRRLETAPADTPPGTAAGPLRVSLERVDRLGDAGLRLQVRLRWRADLQPVLLRLPLASVVAEGPLGEAVPVRSRRGSVEPLLTAGCHWVDLPLRLGPPPAGLTAVDSLRGTVECWLPGFDHRFTLPLADASGKPSTAAVTSLGGVDVECEAWSLEPPDPSRPRARLNIRLSARFSEPSEAFASHRDWLADRQPQLLLPDGTLVRAAGHRVVGRNRQGLTVEGSFPLPESRPGGGLRVAWRLPLGVSRLRFDFRLPGFAFAPGGAGPETGDD